MTHHSLHRWSRLRGAGLLVAAILACTAPAYAQRDEGPEAKQTVAMSQEVYEKIKQAQELIEEKSYGPAQDILNRLAQRSKLSSYEIAQINNLSAYGYYLQERYQDAIRAYERVLAQPDLPEALVQGTLKTVAQLYFTIEDYPNALEAAKKLIAAVPDPSGDVLMVLGQAYFQLKQYRQAIDPIRQGIRKYEEQGRKPRENWLLLLRVCYYELGDFQKMVDVLKELIRYYPKDQYLLTLAGAYSELGDTKKQLALTEVLLESGAISGSQHWVNLSNLYLMHGIPYKAAQALERQIEANVVEANEQNLRLLSQAWYQAREDRKAIPPLRRAAAMSDDGELYVRLAQSHINLEQWVEAEDAINKALARGGITRSDTANVMLGMALFNQKKLRSARVAFERAMQDGRSERAARQWVSYVDSELKRQATLQQEVPEEERGEADELMDQINEMTTSDSG